MSIFFVTFLIKIRIIQYKPQTNNIMVDLFDTPIKQKKVRNGVIAYQYKNGVININGQKYVMYSMSEAIKKYRKDFPY